jgi:hypothetical protein
MLVFGARDRINEKLQINCHKVEAMRSVGLACGRGSPVTHLKDRYVPAGGPPESDV